jgi:DUF1707 SHOCT-like domain/Domain of unknown function (DUF4190)
MTLEPGRYQPGRYRAAGAQGNLRASTADRERAIDVLKAAFAEGRLTREEFEERTGRVYRSRTYAELAALTADLPVGPLGTLTGAPPAYPVIPQRPKMNSLAVAALVCALIPGLPMAGGLVAGIMARRQIQVSGERGWALATAAIVISSIGIVAFLLFLLLGAAAAGPP